MRRDVVSASFWILIGIWVCHEGYKAGMGTLHEPGSGFLVLGAGALLIGLSILLLLRAVLSPLRGGEASFSMISLRRPILVMLGLAAYAYAFVPLGFALSSLLLFILLMKVVEPQPWSKALLMAFLVTLAAYLLFHVWLGAQLPRGIFPAW